MTGINDLAPFEFFPFAGYKSLRSVGWIDSSTNYARGPVGREIFDKLFELLINPWQPFVSAGFHDCPLCRFTGGPRQIGVNNCDITVGNSNLFIPDDQCVYVAPSTLIHYIDAHDYCPPLVFRQAVLRCPPMRSMDYFRAIRKNVSIKELQSLPDA